MRVLGERDLQLANATAICRSLTQPTNRLLLLLLHPTAAMDVNVGSLTDPVDVQGLAHFLEHMLFLGSKPFPDENEYSRFLSTHGGHSNAFTTATDTTYFFDVAPAHLGGALDRFSRFFIDPLFDESCTERELNAVHRSSPATTVQLLHQHLPSQTHCFLFLFLPLPASTRRT